MSCAQKVLGAEVIKEQAADDAVGVLLCFRGKITWLAAQVFRQHGTGWGSAATVAVAPSDSGLLQAKLLRVLRPVLSQRRALWTLAHAKQQLGQNDLTVEVLEYYRKYRQSSQ